MSDYHTSQFLNKFIEPDFLKSLSDRFDILECIGETKSGETYLLSEKGTENLYVIKTQQSDESKLLGGLKHSGLPVFEDSIEFNGKSYALRKYIDGVPLNKLVEKETNAINIMISLCDILEFLHSQPEPIIHRDIKPSNIIITPDNEVVLIDFGISRKYSEDSEADTTHLGTHKFAPPEQYGFAQTDCRSDIYSLGVVLRYWLTGSADNNAVITDKSLARIVGKCTELAPKMRYQTVSTVKKALINYKSRTRRRIVAGIACVFTACLLLVAGFAVNGYFCDKPNFLYEFTGEILETGYFTHWRDIPEDIINAAEIMVVEYTGTPPSHSGSYTFARYHDWQEFKIGHSRIIVEDERLILDLRGLKGNNLAFAFWDDLYEQSIKRMYLTTYALHGIEPLEEKDLQPPYENVSLQPHEFPYEYLGEIADEGFTLWDNIPWSVITGAEIMVVEYYSSIPLPHYSFVKYSDWQQFNQGDSRITSEDGRLIFDFQGLEGTNLAFSFWGDGFNESIKRIYLTTYELLQNPPESSNLYDDTVNVQLAVRENINWATHSSDAVTIPENGEYRARVQLDGEYPGLLGIGIAAEGIAYSKHDEMMEDAKLAPIRFHSARIRYDSVIINDEIILEVSRYIPNNGDSLPLVTIDWFEPANGYVFSQIWNAWWEPDRLIIGGESVILEGTDPPAYMFTVPDVPFITSIEVKFTISGISDM